MDNPQVTFVNLCVDIDRGKIAPPSLIRRDFELYQQGFYENLNTSLPFVFYTSIENPNIPPHRNDSNVRINYFDKNSIENEFPNFEMYKSHYDTSHKDEISSCLFHYAPLVVLKLKKMIDVINENPFNTDYFIWMDCYFERGLDPNVFKDEILAKDFCNKIVNKVQDKFLLLNSLMACTSQSFTKSSSTSTRSSFSMLKDKEKRREKREKRREKNTSYVLHHTSKINCQIVIFLYKKD
jgi:hypothetical protein